MMEIVIAMFILLMFGLLIMCIAFLFTRSEEKETFEQAPPPKAETAHYLTDKYSNCDIEQAVYEILKEQNQPITGIELATQIGCSAIKIHAICRKMICEGKIQRHIIRGEISAYSLV